MIGNNFIQYLLSHDSKIPKYNLSHRHIYIYMNKIQNMEIMLKKNVCTNSCRGCRAITVFLTSLSKFQIKSQQRNIVNVASFSIKEELNEIP